MVGIKCFGGLLLLLAVSCSESTLKFIDTASYSNLREERLGQSSYYVKLPSTMFIEEAKGKEGQLGYGLYQIDSIKRYERSSGFIEVEHGNPIGGDPDTDKIIEKVRSHFLDGSIQWKITRSETGNFNAVAHHGKLTLDTFSPTRTGLDSMIAIIATLTTKP